MNCDQVSCGMRVRVTSLGATSGWLIAARYLDARKVGVIGTVMAHVPGPGGDVWWVRHDSGNVGAYGCDEMEPLESSSESVQRWWSALVGVTFILGVVTYFFLIFRVH